MSILLIPSKADPERDAVALAWQQSQGEVLRLDRFWDPPEVDRRLVRLYGPDTFCLVTAQKLRLELLSPPDDLLLHVDTAFLKRNIRGLALRQLRSENFPLFVKSIVPKIFRSRVYESWTDLEDECRGLEPDTVVLASEVVTIRAEARAFVLQGQVQTCALYEGEGLAPWDFLQQVASGCQLPTTCVLDAALLDGGWALLEANASWGAGLNGCSPEGVLGCLELATQIAGEFPDSGVPPHSDHPH